MRVFLDATNDGAAKLSRIQKGRFITLRWIDQIYKWFPDPKSSYVANPDYLLQWQQEADADVFDQDRCATSRPKC